MDSRVSALSMVVSCPRWSEIVKPGGNPLYGIADGQHRGKRPDQVIKLGGSVGVLARLVFSWPTRLHTSG
jgi:hypothetical protein